MAANPNLFAQVISGGLVDILEVSISCLVEIYATTSMAPELRGLVE